MNSLTLSQLSRILSAAADAAMNHPESLGLALAQALRAAARQTEEEAKVMERDEAELAKMGIYE